MLHSHNEFREWLVAAAAVAGALGTISAVLYALGRDTVLEARRRPRLSLDLDPVWSPTNLDLVTVAHPESHCARTRVTNAPGRRSAEDVEILITRVKPVEADALEAPLDTRPLKWSNLEEDGQPVTKVSLPPGVTRYVDLISLRPPVVHDGAGALRHAKEGEAALCTPELEVHPKPSDLLHRLVGGGYLLEVVLSARDVDARLFEIGIKSDGRWRDGPDAWKHISLSSPRG